MNKKIIIIEGYLASGKSTFALRLSKSLNVPYLIKDTFKIALCNSISVKNGAESSAFSAVTFDGMIYVTERMLETSIPIIIEGNFVPTGVKQVDEAQVIKRLIDKKENRLPNAVKSTKSGRMFRMPLLIGGVGILTVLTLVGRPYEWIQRISPVSISIPILSWQENLWAENKCRCVYCKFRFVG